LIKAFFVTDIHGSVDRYRKLFSLIEKEEPEILFLGGDILPTSMMVARKDEEKFDDFFQDFLVKGFQDLRNKMKEGYPEVFVIAGNDDGKDLEYRLLESEKTGVWKYINNKSIVYKGFEIFGYCWVPPTPFRLKDWERYDVSRYVDPGCVSPEEGGHHSDVNERDLKFKTIKEDLDELTENRDISKSIFLFHSPPYKTNLDRAALDGKFIDYAPLDVHVGSIAIQRFIQNRQPLFTLHGHIHESTRITGEWADKMGNTLCLNAAHDGIELSVIMMDLEDLKNCIRILI
jgi:uncharacterized protein